MTKSFLSRAPSHENLLNEELGLKQLMHDKTQIYTTHTPLKASGQSRAPRLHAVACHSSSISPHSSLSLPAYSDIPVLNIRMFGFDGACSRERVSGSDAAKFALTLRSGLYENSKKSMQFGANIANSRLRSKLHGQFYDHRAQQHDTSENRWVPKLPLSNEGVLSEWRHVVQSRKFGTQQATSNRDAIGWCSTLRSS